ncbi:MAG: hypothetical protein KAJ35_00580, partial [Thermoplasmata archaeon]|nr:hypothetical protein [Thermoplasmata archaeon]
MDQMDYPEIRLQVNLFANGSDNPKLLSWSVAFCDVDLWHDPFIGIGRDASHGNLHLGDGTVKPVDPIVSGGLKGSYYDNMDLTGFEYSNPHEIIDFDWGYNGPAGLGPNSFSIRWDGYVRVHKAESYTFYVRSDDGSRMWIDGQLKIDKWVDQSPTETSTTLHLEPGYYEIRIDYYENSLTALCEFRYSSPSIAKKIVPAEVLYAGGISDLVSETINLPQGYKWELLLIERIEGTEGTISVDVMDAVSNRSIFGWSNILGEHLDLSEANLDRYTSIQLKARWNVTNVTQAPELSHWIVKWVKKGMWREQFYIEARAERLVDLVVEDGVLTSIAQGPTAPILLFAGLIDDSGQNVQSYAFLDGGGLDYLSKEPMALDAWGASALDVADVNGDGYPEVAFSVYRTIGTKFLTTSPMFMGSPVGWRDAPLSTFPTTGATDVLLRDLNDDNHV